jgi:hypothetical protein
MRLLQLNGRCRGGCMAAHLALAVVVLASETAASAAERSATDPVLPIGQPLAPTRIVPVPLGSTRVPWWTNVREPSGAAPRGRLLTMDPAAYARSKAWLPRAFALGRSNRGLRVGQARDRRFASSVGACG